MLPLSWVSYWKIMDLKLKSFNFLLIILVLSAALLPTLMAVDIIEVDEENDLTEDDFFIAGDFLFAMTGASAAQMSILLKAGLSIFALLVVYLGGRSKHKRFNDRTLDHVNALNTMYLKTALSIEPSLIFRDRRSASACLGIYF